MNCKYFKPLYWKILLCKMTRKYSQIISWFMSKSKVFQMKMKIRFLNNMLHSHCKMVKFFQFDAVIQELCQLEIHSFTVNKISAGCYEWHYPAVCTRPLDWCNLPILKTLPKRSFHKINKKSWIFFNVGTYQNCKPQNEDVRVC